jgi:3-hydroxybutyryl-CoA dehydrogenase
MEIKTIGVVGSGAMGSGIAQVSAQAGMNVIVRDVENRFIEAAIKRIDDFLTKSVEKNKMTGERKKEILSLIKGTTKMDDLKDADFVVEAIPEDLNLKKSVFKELSDICRPEAVLSTNTSSMSITEIAMSTTKPDRIIGMHFFNPVPIMRLVEIVRGYLTSDETVRITYELAVKMGKETVEVKKDTPGFIVNRIMIPHFIEAINMLDEGIATREDIDKAVKLGLNYPMGPFELMDLTGIDIAKHTADYLYNELPKENKWTAPTLLKTLIRAGRLGRKTGAGWYNY